MAEKVGLTPICYETPHIWMESNKDGQCILRLENMDREWEDVGHVHSPVDAFMVAEALEMYFQSAGDCDPFLRGMGKDERVNFARFFPSQFTRNRSARVFTDNDVFDIGILHNNPLRLMSANLVVNEDDRNECLIGSLKDFLGDERVKAFEQSEEERLFVLLSPGEERTMVLRKILGDSIDVLPVYAVHVEGHHLCYGAAISRIGTIPLFARPFEREDFYPIATFGHVAYMSAEQRRRYFRWKTRMFGKDNFDVQVVKTKVTFNGTGNGNISRNANPLAVYFKGTLSEEGEHPLTLAGFPDVTDVLGKVVSAVVQEYLPPNDPYRNYSVVQMVDKAQISPGYRSFLNMILIDRLAI